MSMFIILVVTLALIGGQSALADHREELMNHCREETKAHAFRLKLEHYAQGGMHHFEHHAFVGELDKEWFNHYLITKHKRERFCGGSIRICCDKHEMDLVRSDALKKAVLTLVDMAEDEASADPQLIKIHHTRTEKEMKEAEEESYKKMVAIEDKLRADVKLEQNKHEKAHFEAALAAVKERRREFGVKVGLLKPTAFSCLKPSTWCKS